MDRIERAYRKKLKLAELYGVSVTAIVWMGGNRFVIVNDGTETEVIC